MKIVQFLNSVHVFFFIPDLVYFVYLNTDRAFRDQHLETCLKLYYDQFATYFDENLSYSYEDFREEFNQFKNIGFTTACSVMPNILSDKAIDIEGITAIRELQRKQVRLLKYKVSPYAPS